MYLKEKLELYKSKPFSLSKFSFCCLSLKHTHTHSLSLSPSVFISSASCNFCGYLFLAFLFFYLPLTFLCLSFFLASYLSLFRYIFYHLNDLLSISALQRANKVSSSIVTEFFKHNAKDMYIGIFFLVRLFIYILFFIGFHLSFYLSLCGSFLCSFLFVEFLPVSLSLSFCLSNSLSLYLEFRWLQCSDIATQCTVKCSNLHVNLTKHPKCAVFMINI